MFKDNVTFWQTIKKSFNQNCEFFKLSETKIHERQCLICVKSNRQTYLFVGRHLWIMKFKISQGCEIKNQKNLKLIINIFHFDILTTEMYLICKTNFYFDLEHLILFDFWLVGWFRSHFQTCAGAPRKNKTCNQIIYDILR